MIRHMATAVVLAVVFLSVMAGVTAAAPLSDERVGELSRGVIFGKSAQSDAALDSLVAGGAAGYSLIKVTPWPASAIETVTPARIGDSRRESTTNSSPISDFTRYSMWFPGYVAFCTVPVSYDHQARLQPFN